MHLQQKFRTKKTRLGSRALVIVVLFLVLFSPSLLLVNQKDTGGVFNFNTANAVTQDEYNACVNASKNQEEKNECIQAFQKTKAQEVAKRDVKEPGCSIFNIGDSFLRDCIMVNLAEIMLSLVGGLAWMTGLLMDESIKYTLHIASSEGLMASVSAGWVVFRDLANMLFIFVLLFIAIATILQLEQYNTKQLLAKLIIVALLINFSLFATKVVIDVSNVLALQFYSSVTKEGGGSISGAFMQHMGLQGLYDTKTGEVQIDFDSVSIGTIMIFGSIFILIAAFVFLAGAIMFAVRTVSLIFLMMLSPLAFLGMVLPRTRVHANKWWDTLFNQSFVAPLYLILIWASLQVMKGIAGSLPGSKDVTFATTLAGKGSVEIILNFVLVSALLIASLTVAKTMSETVGGMSRSWAGKAAGFVGGTAGGRFARGTLGWGANTLANSKRFRDATTAEGFSGWAARRAMTGTRAVAKSSLDFRNAPGVSKIPGVSLGKAGGKGGYNAAFKKQMERKRDAAKHVGESTLEERERAGESREKLKGYTDELKKAEKEYEEAKLDETKKVIQKNIDGLKEKIESEKTTLDSAENAGKRRKATYENRLATKGDGTLSLLKRAVGLKPSRTDREAALASRKGEDSMKQVRKMIKDMEKKGLIPKEEEATSSEKGKEGAEEIKGNFKT